VSGLLPAVDRRLAAALPRTGLPVAPPRDRCRVEASASCPQGEALTPRPGPVTSRLAFGGSAKASRALLSPRSK
jgi:hypothetical protein